MRKTLGHRARVDTLSAPKASRSRVSSVATSAYGRFTARPILPQCVKLNATFRHDLAETKNRKLRARQSSPRSSMTSPDPTKEPLRRADLHSHNFVFNITKTGKGKPKSIDMAELYHCQSWAQRFTA
jgi:hypothetical protein